MKLKFKLIPLTALATAAAVATPLAVSSCAKQNETFDLTHGYIPEIEQYSGNSVLSQYQATAAYVQFAKENPEALIKDLAYGAANQWQEIFSRFGRGSKGQTYNLTANQISFSATQPTFGTAKVQFAGEEPLDYPTISFTTTQKIDCKLTYKPSLQLQATLSAEYDYQFDIVTEYKDVVFFACPFNPVRKMVGSPFTEEDIDPTGRTWYISFLDGSMSPEAIIANSNPWSINASTTAVAHVIAKDTAGNVITDTTDTTKVSTVINSIISLRNVFEQEYQFLSTVFQMSQSSSPEALTKWRQYYDAGMMLWGATLNHKSYYLDSMYHAPSIVNKAGKKSKFSMMESYMPLCNSDPIAPGEAEEISLDDGLEYILSRYTAQDKTVDIGNVSLILDNPIYLPKAELTMGETPKFIQIGEVGTTEYPILVWPQDWKQGDDIPPVELPAKLVAKDESGAYVPSPYTAEEIERYGEITDEAGKYSMDFKVNKKQLTIEIPVYEQIEDGWKLIDTITSIIDIRTNVAKLLFDINA